MLSTFYLLFPKDPVPYGSMPNNLFIKNCSVTGRHVDRGSQDLIIERGRVAKIGSGLKPPPGFDRLEGSDKLVMPGFIDVHVQGAGGADVLDGTEEALRTISITCARYGVTGFLATTVYRQGDDNVHLQTAARNVGKDLGGARLLGIHLEGPFISSARRGMIQADSLCPPSVDELNRILELSGGTLRIMTIAPELEGNLQIIERLKKVGTVASFGHSAASYEQALAGIDAGITHVTHLYNAMPPMHHRDPGPLPALVQSSVSVQVIPDGVHIHPAMLDLTCKLFGHERIVSITDGMQAMGLPEGEYEYNGVRYLAQGGTARYQDGTLIGTALGMDELVRRLRHYGSLTREQALRTANINPAQVLGIDDRKGVIEEGRDADLAVLDSDLRVIATIVSGKVVYER